MKTLTRDWQRREGQSRYINLRRVEGEEREGAIRKLDDDDDDDDSSYK